MIDPISTENRSRFNPVPTTVALYRTGALPGDGLRAAVRFATDHALATGVASTTRLDGAPRPPSRRPGGAAEYAAEAVTWLRRVARALSREALEIAEPAD